MKVYIIIQHGDNGQDFDDYRTYSKIHSVYSSLELANEAISKLPNQEVINEELKFVEGFDGSTDYPEPWYETDENGKIVTIPIYNPVSYTINEHFVQWRID